MVKWKRLKSCTVFHRSVWRDRVCSFLLRTTLQQTSRRSSVCGRAQSPSTRWFLRAALGFRVNSDGVYESAVVLSAAPAGSVRDLHEELSRQKKPDPDAPHAGARRRRHQNRCGSTAQGAVTRLLLYIYLSFYCIFLLL